MINAVLGEQRLCHLSNPQILTIPSLQQLRPAQANQILHPISMPSSPLKKVLRPSLTDLPGHQRPTTPHLRDLHARIPPPSLSMQLPPVPPPSSTKHPTS